MYERKNSRLVIVDGKTFISVKEAAKAYKFNATSLYQALHNGQTLHRGHKICYSVKTVNAYRKEQDMLNKTNSTSEVITTAKRKGRESCPVKCTTTGKYYPSISAAAKELGLHMWTMSVKMEDTGKFIDKNGNEYIRLKPMNKLTDRTYNTKYSSITRDIKPYTKKNTDKQEELSLIKSSVVTPIIPIKTKQTEVVASLLKSASLLVDNKNYVQAASIYNILADVDK